MAALILLDGRHLAAAGLALPSFGWLPPLGGWGSSVHVLLRDGQRPPPDRRQGATGACACTCDAQQNMH
eukprot:11694928-Prorocentrum_lima.AAC.1